MFGPLGYELDLFHLSEAEKQAIKSQIVFYKKQRQLLTFGTFYQLQQLDHGNEKTWAVYDPQNEEALIAFFRVLAQANPTAEDFLPAAFLDGQKVYQVNGETVSGQLLKQLGCVNPISLMPSTMEQRKSLAIFNHLSTSYKPKKE